MFLDSSAALENFPKRIVSLVPSQTELLYWLGLEQETIGITKFCVHPKSWFHEKTKVGGTKTVKRNIIHRLQPDLIIANKEENLAEQVEDLAKEYPVWLTDVKTLEDALKMIGDIGTLTNKNKEALKLIVDIKNSFKTLNAGISSKGPGLRTAYLIWREPYLTTGGDTFISDMLSNCGLDNIFAGSTRYPEVTITQLQDARCQLLFLSSEPFPFTQKHLEELQIHLPLTRIILVDGEMFSWYGSRLLIAADYFRNLITSLL